MDDATQHRSAAGGKRTHSVPRSPHIDHSPLCSGWPAMQQPHSDCSVGPDKCTQRMTDREKDLISFVFQGLVGYFQTYYQGFGGNTGSFRCFWTPWCFQGLHCVSEAFEVFLGQPSGVFGASGKFSGLMGSFSEVFPELLDLHTLFLPLSQDCRLARIWLSIADTHESLSSRLVASKCHVCPVNDTMIKSAFSSSADRRGAEPSHMELS